MVWSLDSTDFVSVVDRCYLHAVGRGQLLHGQFQAVVAGRVFNNLGGAAVKSGEHRGSRRVDGDIDAVDVTGEQADNRRA